MQRNMLTEFQLPKLEFKNQKNVTKNSNTICYLLQDNAPKCLKTCETISLPYKSPKLSVISDFPKTLPTPKNLDTIGRDVILKKRSKRRYKRRKNDRGVITSGIYHLAKNSSILKRSPIAPAVTCNKNIKTNSNTRLVSSLIGNADFSTTVPRGQKLKSSEETKPLPNIFIIKNNAAKIKVHPKLDKDSNQSSLRKSLLRSNAKAPKSLQKNSSGLSAEKSKTATKNVINDKNFTFEEEPKPLCVISEVFGNADAAFSGAFDSPKNLELCVPEIVFSEETPDLTNQQIKTDSTSISEVEQSSGNATDSLAIAEEKGSAGFCDLLEDATAGVLETEVVSFCEIGGDINETNISNGGVEVFENEAIIHSKEDLSERSDAVCSNPDLFQGEATRVSGSETNTVKEEEHRHCKENVFSEESDFLEAANQSEPQLITPKKTNDITKIKGWRRKQFLVEKPTTVEFYRIGKRSKQKKIKIKDICEDTISKPKEPSNVENAFTCDSLDKFLDGEVDLKIGYEIPHLYAESGIKLTREEILSKPNFSDKDFKEVENRYRVSVPAEKNIANLDEIDEESHKPGKRPAEDDTKPIKFLKIGECKKQPGKFLKKPLEKLKIKTKKITENTVCKTEVEINEKNETELKTLGQSTENINNVKLESKLLGLVVYPGPLQPLHPLVQFHLEKLRSYSTKIDKNWANFAASAVFDNEKQYRRRILPVYCCVKVKENNAEAFREEKKDVVEADSVVEEEFVSKKKDANKSDKGGEGKIKLKECCVVIDKIDLVEAPPPWCMEHHTYDCEPCGLLRNKFRNVKELTGSVQRISTEGKRSHQNDEVAVLPEAKFNVKIANLLSKKLRILKFIGDTLTDINCLKTLVPDNVEFIKLKYVQESFQKANIRIWYLKQLTPSSRARAFLSFSESPPVPNAISLKPEASSMRNVPKIISEVMSPEKVFSPNEYAILHCNGEVWEIHGSLNIVFDRADKNVEQIFASLPLPELEELKKVAQKVLKVQAFKWWVLDLSQDFRLIEIKLGNVVSILSRNKLIELTKCDPPGFIPLRKHSKGRILGAYLIEPLLPFVLIGPYNVFESHNMTLRSESSVIPFMYFVKENVMKEAPLKYFINSVIKDLEDSNKILDGLWLYDKMCLESTSYIEVQTRSLGSSVQRKFPNIDIEHGYSLNSLTNGLPPGVTAEFIKRKDGQKRLKKILVYLYFDVFELGYVEGELQRDNSVIINHPLDRRTKVKSHKMGDWFVRTIRRRIEFIPRDIEVKWFITRHKDDLRGRRPFNKFLLDGAHVLTKNGIFYLLEISESKIEKLGLKQNEFARVITENQLIRLVLEMKNLANVLTDNPGEILTMEKLLSMAITQIKVLESLGESLEKEKSQAENEKHNLISSFLKILNSCEMDDQVKLKRIENIEHFFLKENGDLNEEFVTVLKSFHIGRRYFRQNLKYFQSIAKIRDGNGGDANAKAPKETPE